ncbi:hypothetical protein ACET3Z_022233 [Daucus carota]
MFIFDHSRIVRRVTYERANRSCSVGDYHKKPAREEDNSIVHFLEGRNIREAKKKKTLSYIIKVNWREDTHESKGLEREAFYDRCLRDFKGCERVCEEELEESSFSGKEEGRAISCICKEEFLDHVYHFDDPATKKLKADMERVRASQPNESPYEESTLDPPPSPRTLKAFHLRRDLSLTIQARPPKKGKVILHPRHSVAEVFRGYKAAELTSTQSQQISNPTSVQFSTDSITTRKSRIDIRGDAPALVSKILDQLMKSDKYGERRGATFGLAGLVNGFRISCLKKYGIAAILREGLADSFFLNNCL